MKNYFGPYVEHPYFLKLYGLPAYGRKQLNGGISLVYQYSDGSWTHVRNETGKTFKTIEEARASLDKQLLNKEDAVFLTEEQFNRLELLK